jgi:transaldolase
MDHRDRRTDTLTLDRDIAAGDLRVKVFADGADVARCRELAADPQIKGFTTNPTLMRKIGVTDYRKFAAELLEAVGDRPISFEVFSDEMREMERQARTISSWGDNVFVKIPVTNCEGRRTDSLLRQLVANGIKVNVTGLMTLDQVAWVSRSVAGSTPAYISVFAGRIADAGIDPVPVMSAALELLADHPNQELIWASPREILNIVQADQIGCDIITVTHDLLGKLPLLGKDLDEFSLDTVRMFRDDALRAGYTL